MSATEQCSFSCSANQQEGGFNLSVPTALGGLTSATSDRAQRV